MLKLLLLLSSLTLPFKAHAYESMIRHGYASCVTCHLSQTGAGLLNSYGKVIAQQFSAFSKMEMPKKSNFSQGLQTRLAHYRSNGQTRNFPMQFDYLAAFQRDKFTIEGTLAKAPKDESNEEESSFAEEIYVRKALVSYELDKENIIQLGRDYIDSGLNLIDHTLFVRRNNKRGVTDFFTILRSSHTLKKNWKVIPTLFMPSFQEFSENQEKGLALKVERFMPEQKWVLALSALGGQTDTLKRREVNISFKKAWKHLVLLGQYGLTHREIRSDDKSFNQRTALLSSRLFPLESLEVYFNWENIDVEDPFLTKATRYGHGLRLKPLSNLSLEYDAKRNTHTGSKFQSIFQIYFNGWFL